MKKLFCAALLAVHMLGLSVLAGAYADLPAVDVRAKAAILVDAAAGEILYQKNIHDRLPPASVTKVMTALLVLEKGNPDDIVTASEASVSNISDDESRINIKPGEEFTVRDLLYAAVVASANDACHVLAEYVAGTPEAFVGLMNERAAELGMNDTHFANTSGMPDQLHLTSAYDLYLLCLEAMKNQLFMDMAHTQAYTIPPTNLTPGGYTLYTTNRLISNRQSSEYIYPYARGIKTGSTQEAGYCLASSAAKDGLALISVVLGAEREEDTGLIRSFTETRDLFEWGFSSFAYKQILPKSQPVTDARLIEGLNADSVVLGPEEAVTALVPRALKPEDIERSIELFEPEGTMAPVYKGQIMGKLKLSYEGHEYATVNLLAQVSVERSETDHIRNTTAEFIAQPWVKWTVAGVIAAIALYTAVVVAYNVRRRKSRATGFQSYRGSKRRK